MPLVCNRLARLSKVAGLQQFMGTVSRRVAMVSQLRQTRLNATRKAVPRNLDWCLLSSYSIRMAYSFLGRKRAEERGLLPQIVSYLLITLMVEARLGDCSLT